MTGSLTGKVINCAGISPAFVPSEKLDVGAFQQLGCTATYLLSDDASYVTGTTINIGGGWQAW